MLFLTRKAGEALMIGDEVTVTVIEIRGSQVRLGIDAPKGIRVQRLEIGGQDACRRGPGVIIPDPS